MITDMANDYGFVVVHVPHASTLIPGEYGRSILLDEKRLHNEMRRMTDHFCDELYAGFPEFANRAVVAPVSRLVCDMERFRDDKAEPRARWGQGLMYTRTHSGRRLRRYDESLREKILREFYDPHHLRLTEAVEAALARYGKCLIVDGHSFNSRMIIKPDNLISLPDFDIGTDDYHTPAGLLDAICGRVKELGYRPKVNSPFGGAITPMKFYRQNKRVYSVMIETNRKLYMNEKDITKTGGFEKTRAACRELMLCAAEYIRDLRE